jgi:predicted anti-sigma-YlaC factor YlaD
VTLLAGAVRVLPVVISSSALLFSQGCALKTVALKSVASTLSASGDTFSSDEDPELVRDAVPFALKTYESLLASLPNHRGLLLATCSGFTQYSYGFVQADAERVEQSDFERSLELRERSLKLYLRGRDYCLRALDTIDRRSSTRLRSTPDSALVAFERKYVPVLYWTAASWGAAVSLGLDRPALVGDMPIVRALVDRALVLDESYGEGSLHELLIRARQHFERAVALQHGRSAGPYVTLATAVALPAQDRAEFVRLLEQALSIDPSADRSRRLANLIAQQCARDLLSRVDDLIPSAEGRQP